MHFGLPHGYENLVHQAQLHCHLIQNTKQNLRYTNYGPVIKLFINNLADAIMQMKVCHVVLLMALR